MAYSSGKLRVIDSFDALFADSHDSVSALDKIILYPINVIARFFGCLFELLLQAALVAIEPVCPLFPLHMPIAVSNAF